MQRMLLLRMMDRDRVAASLHVASVNLADQAFEVFGFGQVEDYGVILGCAAALEEGDAPMGIDCG